MRFHGQAIFIWKVNHVQYSNSKYKSNRRQYSEVKEAGLSVKDIQNACGFGTPQAVYKWQQGLALPAVDNLLVLSYLFGVTIDEILIEETRNRACNRRA